MKIIEPTLLLDTRICRENISAMSGKAAAAGVTFRPHFKTHQSKTIGRWFRDAGVGAITVSSLRMARYFADDGWKDITVAFPTNLLEIDRIRELASRISLNLLLVSGEPIEVLERGLGHSAGVFIKIDAGYHRTGIPSTELDAIDTLIGRIAKCRRLRFRGFLTHAGNTYTAGSSEEIRAITTSARRTVAELKAHFRQKFPDLIVSIGDTPGCSLTDEFAGADEIRPGNFVFYDAMQFGLGACAFNRIAVAMACPVVALHPDRSQCILYGGAIHFSKDHLLVNEAKSFGPVVALSDHGWSPPVRGAFLSSLSQEHGVVTSGPEFLRTVHVGSVIGIIPVHSCLTADCMKGYLTLDGERIDHMQGFRE